MKKNVTLPGSDRRPLPGAKVVGAVDPEQRIEITLQVRRKPGSNLDAAVSKIASQPLAQRQYLTRAELAEQSGADPADIAKIDTFAHAHGLSVTEADAARRTVKLSGTIKDLSSAFGVKLQRYKAGNISYRGRTGTISIPSEIADVVERVLGLDDRPIVRPHFRRLATAAGKGRAKNGARGGKKKPKQQQSISYSPVQVADIYDFPSGLDGTGQTIALIELNDVDNQGNATGSGYATSDLDAFFENLGIPVPDVTAVGIDGGANVPGQDADADGEVTLDIEVAGSVAPGAKIAVYFGTNTDDGFIQVLSAAIHDDVRKPSVVSISWGQAEETATSQMLQGLQQALQEAAALGVTVCVAAGDNGSADELQNTWDGKPHVDFPASSPYSLACGGTSLNSGSQKGAPVEVVWNKGTQGGATGGGVSNFFAKPSYQSGVNVPAPPAPTNGNSNGRGVPDVAGDADPYTGYNIYVGGKAQVFGGTSAVAPLYAGLLARLNQSLTTGGGNPIGFANPLLYPLENGANGSGTVFHDVTSGNNDIYNDLKGEYPAGPGWDPCTGLGSIDGANLLAALPKQQPAPAPNPSSSASVRKAKGA